MPECYDKAAIRHYLDAEYLADNTRFDNASHLIGFAVECAIKHVCDRQMFAASPNIHLPAIANAALKIFNGRRASQHPMRSLLEQTRDIFFHDWRVSARYDSNSIDSETYKKWKKLADRTMCAANLSLVPKTRRGQNNEF